MDAFFGQVRLFLRRLDQWLTTADEPEAMVQGDADDLLLLGETIHHHLVGMVEGGENGLTPLGRYIGSLVEAFSAIASSFGHTVDMRALTAGAIATGSRGRPRLDIGQEQLIFLVDHGFSVSSIAELLGVCRSTVNRRMREWDLSVARRYADINDAELDRTVLEIKRGFPDAGYSMMDGLLRSRGIIIQRHRIRLSVARVDPIGVAERWATSIPRRVYRVSGPNALWHVDGNHKLIRYV